MLQMNVANHFHRYLSTKNIPLECCLNIYNKNYYLPSRPT